MSRVNHYGHGVYCYACQAVYAGTDGCEHSLAKKAGVKKQVGGDYLAKPAEMGHNGPHWFVEIEGMQQCAECDAVKLSAEMIP